MRYYIRLQFLRMNRLLKASGLHPVVAYLLVGMIFVVASHLIITTLIAGKWMYMLVGLYLFSHLRNTELTVILFTKKHLLSLHLMEAILCAVPFGLILSIYHSPLEGLILIALVSCASLFRFRISGGMTLPTPFHRDPFEFASGFRKYWIAFVLLYLLYGIGLFVGNFNLAIFSLALLYLSFMTFYGEPENEFFVWVFAMPPNQFLLRKIQTVLRYSLLLTLPLLLGAYIQFPERWIIITLLCIVGLSLPVMALLNKYAHYPQQSEFIHAILIGACLVVPPLLLFVLPYLAHKALSNLKGHL
ncbi:MAG: hypothetical protein AAGA85_13325 [Bacteroidota bacterium]